MVRYVPLAQGEVVHTSFFSQLFEQLTWIAMHSLLTRMCKHSTVFAACPAMAQLAGVQLCL